MAVAPLGGVGWVGLGGGLTARPEGSDGHWLDLSGEGRTSHAEGSPHAKALFSESSLCTGVPAFLISVSYPFRGANRTLGQSGGVDEQVRSCDPCSFQKAQCP